MYKHIRHGDIRFKEDTSKPFNEEDMVDIKIYENTTICQDKGGGKMKFKEDTSKP